jgi:hypothetical protein
MRLEHHCSAVAVRLLPIQCTTLQHSCDVCSPIGSAIAHHVQPVLTVLYYGCTSRFLLLATATTAFTVCLDGFEKSDGKRALRLRLCGPGHYLHHKCILAAFKATGPKVTYYTIYIINIC